MWIWDGTDRQEDDLEAAFAEKLRQAMVSSNPAITDFMKSFTAAISLAVTGRPGSKLVAPEPLIQGGFTPSDDERDLMCECVERSGRDLVHICFRSAEPYTPTGLVVAVFNDKGRIRLHSRCAIMWARQDKRVQICGVEDELDQFYKFVFKTGQKLDRFEGHGPIEVEMLKQAEYRVMRLTESGSLGNVEHEALGFYHNDRPIWARP